MSERVAASKCLDEIAVLGYLDGSEVTEAVETHLADCGACRMLVRLAAPARAHAGVADDTGNAPTLAASALFQSHRPTAALVAGDTLGRYKIIAPLGAGGMGVVYVAHDPSLDRRVAIKLMQGPSSPRAGALLMQEGRAVARLAHANVVTVYDLGEDRGQWYVAMELVEGGTLADWRRAAPRTSRDILSMFIAAGRGLVAAHAAGLVHRDFKPANVLVGNDDRPRVSDFGLAILDELQPPDALHGRGTSSAGTPGTPAYMAPEQIDGGLVDARADQFSFAVALFEALDGKRPFLGTTLAAIRDSMRAGPSTLRAFVPLRVITALRRALSESADDRFPSMMELLREIAPWRVRPVHLAAFACTLVVGAIGAKLLLAEPAPAACTGLDHSLTGVWDRTRGDSLAAAFEKTGMTGVADTARAVHARLDRYATSLTTERVDACEAAQVRRDQTPAQQELRTVCLDERLGELRVATDVLLAPDQDVIANAHTLVASLTPPEACRDLATLSERLPVASAPQMAQTRVLRAQFVRVRTQVAAGQFAIAADQLALLRTAIAQTGYRPLQAEAALAAGILAEKQGYLAQAETDTRDAVLAAEAGRDNRTAALAWIQLVSVRVRRGDIVGASDALEHATATVERLSGDVEARAELACARGLMLREKGDYNLAANAFRDALRMTEQSHLDRSDFTARLQLDLSGVIGALGDHALARTTADAGIAGYRRALGSSHPDLAGALIVAAAGAIVRLDVKTTTTYLDEAEGILRATVGPAHPRFGQLLMVRASVLSAEGKYNDATKLLWRAIELFQQRWGEEHSHVATLHRMIASTASSAGDTKLARSEYVIAATLFERTMGHDSIEALQTRTLEAWLAYAEDDMARAETAARASNDECRRLLGNAHPYTAEAARTLGYILDGAGKRAEAVVAYHEAIETMARGGAAGLRITARYQRELGEVLLLMKQYDDATAALDAALALERSNSAEQTADGRTARYLLAEAHRGAGRRVASITLLEALVAEMSLLADGATDPMLHRARMWLGIQLAETGRDPKRARNLVAGARTALAKLDSEAVTTADAWLRTHR